MCDGGISVDDLQVLIEVIKECTIKLLTIDEIIIQDKTNWQIMDFQMKLWASFLVIQVSGSTGEIVDGDDEELSLTRD